MIIIIEPTRFQYYITIRWPQVRDNWKLVYAIYTGIFKI